MDGEGEPRQGRRYPPNGYSRMPESEPLAPARLRGSAIEATIGAHLLKSEFS
jgi:hypothetical protein